MNRTPKEIEVKRRINLALWAYAYEFHAHSIVSDALFDFESYMVNLSMDTGNPRLDKWFRENFTPCTGMWIQKHPDLARISQLYGRMFLNAK